MSYEEKAKKLEEAEMSLKLIREHELDEKEKMISKLQAVINSYEIETQNLRDENGNLVKKEREVGELKEHTESLESSYKSREEALEKKIEELIKQNSTTKKELEHEKDALSFKLLESENNLISMNLENEKLKKQIKELNAKLLTKQHESNEMQQLKEKVQELGLENNKLEKQLSNVKVLLFFCQNVNKPNSSFL